MKTSQAPRRQAIGFTRLCLVLLLSTGAPRVCADSRLAKDRPLAKGLEALQRGEFAEAIASFREQLKNDRESSDWDSAVACQLHLGTAYQALGHHKLALLELSGAHETARNSNAAHLIAAAACALASAHTILGHADASGFPHLRTARELLDEAIPRARQLGDSATEAAAHNNYGNWFAAQKQDRAAMTSYQAAAQFAARAGNFLLQAQSLANAARAAAIAEALPDAIRWNTEALEKLLSLPPSAERAHLGTSIGQTFTRILVRDFRGQRALLQRAWTAFHTARETALHLGNRRALSYAAGALARLYELEGRLAEALALVQEALASAYHVELDAAAYRWEWQGARLMAARGENAAALEAYWRAVEAYQRVRQDLALGCSNQSQPGFSEEDDFERSTGALFRELAALLFARAEQAGDPIEAQRYLADVRRAIEILRAAELEDYLRDECVSIVRSRAPQIEWIGDNTAVLYVVSLKHEVKLLVASSPRSGQTVFEHRTSAIDHDELVRMTERCRRLLEKGTTDEYYAPATQLYRWLIAPIEPILIQRRVETLVVVADGVLRLIPFAALYDGEQFLAQKYATAVTPALTLLESQSLAAKSPAVLVGALSKGSPALPYVRDEIEAIREIYPRVDVLSDEAFTWNNWTQRMTEGRYAIVHLATHGKFEPTARRSFIQTYDTALDLDQLERCVRPKKFRGQPVELLVLSACQTAASDERTALGLAGVAVKCGARSALATLWHVNDQASARLISEFYAQLRDRPGLSKASALRAAQLRLLAEGWQHPRFWSPYLIVGNWR